MYVCSECGASQAGVGACANDGTALAPIGDDVLLGTTVGAYRVARLLGLGGMGRVYKGVHPTIGSRVAIKVLSRECSDRRDLVERFFAEAKAVNLIRHESIVNVLDLAMLPDGRPYIIMEYLDGAPLATIIEHAAQARMPLPLGSIARLAVEVLDALGAAHAKGIVHRDLKPDNIFVTPSGRPKVLDFGIAKLSDSSMSSATRTGSLLGTPHYMAPEQAAGRPVDHRADIYAMGVILFECATGVKPFVAESLFDLLRKHVEAPAPSPRQLRGDLTPPLDQLILTALEKAPERRFGSAQAMSVALQNATATLPAEQWLPISGSGTYRLQPSGGWHSGPMSRPPQPPAIGHVSTVSASTVPLPHATRSLPAPAAGASPKKGVWIGLGAVALVGGGVAVGIAASRDEPSPAPSPSAMVDVGKLQDDMSRALQQMESLNLSPAMQRQLETMREAQALPPEQRAAKLAELQQQLAEDYGDVGRDLAGAPPGAGPVEADDPVPPPRPGATPKPPPVTAPSPVPPPRPAGTWLESRDLGFPLQYRPSRADVGALVRWAIAEARKTVPDAELYWVDADNVAPDGTMNMTLPSFASDHGSINLRFRSPSQMKREPSIPKGVPQKASCEFRIELEPDGAEIRRIDDSRCDRSYPVQPPKCTPVQLWKRALAQGAPSDGVANINYRATSAGSPGKWFFDIGTPGDKLFSTVFDDGC